MCRMLYISDFELVKKRVSFGRYAEWLLYLEAVNGGHGNGIGGVKGNNFYIQKGPDMHPIDLALHLWVEKWKNGAFFHSRLASAGEIDFRNTQPIVDHWGQIIVIHNGHGAVGKLLKELREYDSYFKNFDVYSKYIYSETSTYEYNSKSISVSDTWVLTNWLGMKIKEGNDTLDVIKSNVRVIEDFGNVFIMDKSGNAYIIISNRDNQVYTEKGEIIVASEGIKRFLGLDAKEYSRAFIYKPAGGKVKFFYARKKLWDSRSFWKSKYKKNSYYYY